MPGLAGTWNSHSTAANNERRLFVAIAHGIERYLSPLHFLPLFDFGHEGLVLATRCTLLKELFF